MPTLPKKARALLQKAQATLYNIPQTPLGYTLKKQLATEKSLEQLEKLIGKYEEKFKIASVVPRQESPLVTNEEHARALLEEKIKPALQEVLQ